MHCALGSCWEPQDITPRSHHLQAQPQPQAWGCVQRKGVSSLEPGRTRWVPSTAFREVFLQKLKLDCKNKPLLWSGLLGAVSWLRQRPGRRSRSLGTTTPVPAPTVSRGAPGGHTLLLLLPDPICAWPGTRASSAGRFRAPPSPGEPAQQTLMNVTTITRRPPRPRRRQRSCSSSPAPTQPLQEGWDSGWLPALAHALVSSEPRIPRALLSPA